MKETHTHKTGFKQLFRRLRSIFRPEKLDSRDDINPENLADAALIVFGCPCEKFTRAELETLRDYVIQGGALLVLMAEGGETKSCTNLNYMLEEFGIAVNPDFVVRMVHHKYMHPKEVLVSDGIVNRGVVIGAGKGGSDAKSKGGVLSELDTNELDDTKELGGDDFDGKGLDFVYPYGATLSVQKPSTPILSSGGIAYPMHRPLGAVWHKEGSGRIAALGSVQLFDDKWIDKEENSKLMDFLFKWLRPNSKLELDPHDAEDPNIGDVKHLPDTEALAERPKCCLQGREELPKDWTKLFDDRLFQFDVSLVPEAMDLYDKLGVKKAPLTLIAPQFETPLPPLQPAVFPPAIREPPPPALELFDLDEHFADEHVRLAVLTNKCKGPQDLEYYVQECAHILGTKATGEASGKAILAEVFSRVVNYKMAGAAFGSGGSREMVPSDAGQMMQMMHGDY
ncbi:hypothetical protein BSKO_03290 [Bryopsis sp. KO-2023]|nr:hypothetical protein BSKO_03290 [Bryopsis sp. KO-2023]